MTHAEFVEKYRSGQLDVRVNKPRVGELVKTRSISVRFRAAHRFWMWLWLLSIPFALACLVWGKWWIALVLLCAGFLLPRLVNRSAYYAFVLERALEDEQFFKDAVEAKALLISART
jgi:Flp pilus assembly protein TadB